MNLNNLTYPELVRYLDLTATDTGTRRLLELLYSDSASLYQELLEVGMDPTDYTFNESYDSYSPGEYIRHLQNEVEYYSDQLTEVGYELERAERRIEALEEKIKVWTIMESK